MGHTYQAVLWNPQKKRYDIILWMGIVLLLAVFIIGSLIFHPTITIETLIIRAAGFTAISLLHIVLIIGPLCRLDTRFLPLLYNRRHLGVSMFLIAAVHGVFCIVQFHTLGDINPILSVFTSNENYLAISKFPFQILGFMSLVVLFIMAATSHDFWLKNLSPDVWKALHMLVYLVYGLLIAHVALGTLQYETRPLYIVMLVGGFISITGLHLITGWKETLKLRNDLKRATDGFYNIGPIDDISENCAKTIFVNGENIAVFKYDNKVSAVHNVCKHQMGPLGEGQIVDGCITCPWHGYQYLPHNGQSPSPFNEKVKTYDVKIISDEVWVNSQAHAEGTEVIPANINPVS